MQKFLGIIGQRNSGKSTLIKSLTGCPTNSYRGFVVDEQSGRSIYVVCGSPQEDPEELRDLDELKGILDEVASREGCIGIVMAIQPSQPSIRLSMEGIFQEVQRRKLQIYSYVLDPGRGGNTMPVAAVDIRLKPLGVVSTPLDGRRFAQLNAEFVNSVTHIAR
jgi:energy-coupling factor transporter ATP-binding protein EcfA2